MRPRVSARCSPLLSRTSVVAVLRYSQARQSPAPALPPAPPWESPCPPRAPPHRRATRCDQPKSRRISRRSRTRPFDFSNETAFVRFLSPPLHAGRAILGPCRLFFCAASCRGPVLVTGAIPERTRCNLNSCSGFCRFVRRRAAGCGRLRSRISRRNGCAFRVAL